MKTIIFTVHFSTGMSGEFYSPLILIDKPQMSFSFSFTEKDLSSMNIHSISQLIHIMKTLNLSKENLLSKIDMDNFNVHTTYIQQKDHLYSFEQDKSLNEIFSDFKTDYIELLHFYVAGGASLECNGYRFRVWPNEGSHKHLPHVHVIKGNENVRYSLVTLERIDACSREYLRDEKKKIIPALIRHLPQLQEFWTASMGGYRPPEFDFENKQYYPES